MGDVREFPIVVKRHEVVAPLLLPMQEKWLPISNLDLLLAPRNFSVFFIYKKHNTLSFSFMVNVLKKGLVRVLESYYVLGGEVALNSDGEPQLLCNNRGVDFVEAYADVEFTQLQLDILDGKLVPKEKDGVLCIQVTELKCGGLVVACTFDHRVIDAYSANMFLASWAEASQLKPPSLHPSFQRSFLNPHQLNHFDYASIDNLYTTISLSPSPPTTTTQPPLVSRIFYITAKNISQIQSQANFNGIQFRSKLESFSACLWKTIAKGAQGKVKRCRMGIVVDGRTRLESGTEECHCNYFGNVLSIPFGELSTDDLKTKPLAWVDEAVHKFLEVAMTKEHFLGLTDWVEAHRPQATSARICCDDELSFVVSSGLSFLLSKIDFGSGKPVFGSYHVPWKAKAGYVMPMPSSSSTCASQRSSWIFWRRKWVIYLGP